MAKVIDRWHLARPPAGAKPCGEHQMAGRVLVPSSYHGQGKRWQVRYRDPAGQQKKENYAKKAKADARAVEVQNELDRGEFVDRETRRQTFREFAETWRETSTQRATTEPKVERALRLHVYPMLGDKPLGAITRTDIRRWVRDRSKVLEPISLRTPYHALASVMSAALHDGLTRKNPCFDIDLPEIRKTEVKPLDPLVVQALVMAASPRYAAPIRLDATSGIRGGELFGLEDHHIDVKAGTWTIEQQLVGPDKGVPYLAEPKTVNSYRTGDLAPSAAAAILEHREAYPPKEVWIEDRTNPRKPHWRMARLLFISEAGAPVRRGSWAKVWARTVKRADNLLESWGSPLRVPEGTTLHDLRHFVASILIKHGASVKKVQRILGHAKPSITLDLYVHLWEDDGDDAAELLDKTLSGVPAKCPPELAA